MLFRAIRNHWKVEVNNYIRDVCFGEDKFLSLNSNLQKNVSIFLNLTFNAIKKMLDQKHYKYFIQVREECCWNREFALKSLKLFS